MYSKLVNRPLGRLIAVVAFRWGMTPNQVTGVSALATFTGILLLAVGGSSWLAAIAVCGLLVLGYALDSADGQVARLRGVGRPSGEWLDHVVDSAKVVVIHVAVLVHWFRYLDVPTLLLLIPLVFACVSAIWFFAEILTQMLERLHPRPHDEPRQRPALQPILALPADYGVLAASFFLLGMPGIWVPVYAALAALNSLMLIRQVRVWYRRVDVLAEPAP